MNMEDAYYVVSTFALADVPLFIWGHRGVGKSSLVKQIADDLGNSFVDLRLASQEVGDLIGLPHRDTNRTVWLKPSWFPEEGTSGVLFLDELNRAPRDVRQAVFQLVLDRKLHTHTLPSGWSIVAAGNYSGAYDVDDQCEAFLSRFGHIDVDASAIALCNYATEKKWSSRLVDFLRKHTNYVIHTTNGEEIEQYQPSPDSRRWEMVNRVIHTVEQNKHPILNIFKENERGHLLMRTVLSAIVGDAATQAFMAYSAPLPSFEDILTGEQTYASVKKTTKTKDFTGVIDKICSEIVPILKNRAFNKKELERAITYLVAIERRDIVAGIVQNLIELRRTQRMLDPQWEEGIASSEKMWKLVKHLSAYAGIE